MEIAGEAALYIDPGDIEGLAGAMSRITCDADLRQRLIDSGRRQLARFAWRPEVQTLADALRQVRGAQAAGAGPVQAAFRQAALGGFDLTYAIAAACAAVLELSKRKGAT